MKPGSLFVPAASAVSAASLLALALAMPAVAQTTAAVAAENDEIIVTANRREQKINDVASAVSVLSGQNLADRNLLQIQDFASLVPGFSVQSAGTRGIRLVLRGQNTGGAGASVATVIDDAPVNTASANSNGATVTPNLDTFDLERIEVLRGPQGTLYGATAQGGLLKYVTRTPSLDKVEGVAEAGIEAVRSGEVGYSVKGAVSVPLITDKIAVRVAGYYTDVPGYIDNPVLGEKDFNGGEQYGVRGTLLLKPTEDLTIKLTAFKQWDRYGGPGGVEINGAQVADTETDASYDLISGFDGPVSRLRIPSRVRQSAALYQGVVTYETDAVTLTSSTSYAKVTNSFVFDASDVPAGPGLTLGQLFSLPFLYGQPLILQIDQKNNHNKFNQEFRITSRQPVDVGGLKFDWQLGAFFTDEDIVFDQLFNALSAANPANVLTVPLPFGGSSLPGSYREYAGFADSTVKIGDRIELSFGGRYTHNEQSSQVTNFPGFITAPVLTVNPEVKSSEDKFTWQVAPRLSVTDAVSLYGRVATGYRPGGPVQAIPGAPADFPVQFKSDSTINYEIGTKGKLGALNFDLALYQINWTDVQILSQFTSSNGQTYNVTGNGGRARSRGFEWNFNVSPVKGLTFDWNGAYTDAILTEDAPLFGGFNGDRLPYVPDWSSTVAGDYRFALNDRVAVNVGASWVFVGTRYSGFSSTPVLSNNPRVPSYSTIDLRAGVSLEPWRLDFFVRNVNDSRGLVDYNSVTGFNGATGVGVIVRPRSFGAKLSTRF